MPAIIGQKISQQVALVMPTGAEELVGSYQGRNFRILISTLTALVTKITIGLSEVENVAPLDMPISSFQQTAFNNLANNIAAMVQELQTLSDALAQKVTQGISMWWLISLITNQLQKASSLLPSPKWLVLALSVSNLN